MRLGRQSPLGGGVLGRFDGVQAGYSFRPRWKASLVAGVPTDTLLDAKRHFYGASIDAEALTPQLGGSLYLIEQKIDRQVDRRALGADLRFFDGGVSASGQLDYDVLLKGLNIASWSHRAAPRAPYMCSTSWLLLRARPSAPDDAAQTSARVTAR